jgi:hypothetical protein
VETLAREVAGPGANAQIQELARQVAEAQMDLRRVRYARHQQLLSRTLADLIISPEQTCGRSWHSSAFSCKRTRQTSQWHTC